jgi:hypothetical protein
VRQLYINLPSSEHRAVAQRRVERQLHCRGVQPLVADVGCEPAEARFTPLCVCRSPAA